MALQTFASFVLSLFPGIAVGIILLCAHIRLGGGVERDKFRVHLSQLPFVFGPVLLAVAAVYSISVGKFHPPEIALIAGIVVGMVAVYGYFHLNLKLGNDWKRSP